MHHRLVIRTKNFAGFVAGFGGGAWDEAGAAPVCSARWTKIEVVWTSSDEKSIQPRFLSSRGLRVENCGIINKSGLCFCGCSARHLGERKGKDYEENIIADDYGSSATSSQLRGQ